MLSFLRRLLFGHVHHWETIREFKLTSDFGSTGTRYILRCSECGWIKKRDMI